MARIKTGPKIVLIAAVAFGAVYGLRSAAQHGLIPTPGIMKSLVPQRVVLPNMEDAQVSNVKPQPIPTSDALANVQAPLIRVDMWEWNAQANLIYANGGAQTTKGSLMEKYGANVLLNRDDDNNNEMVSGLVACAKQLAGGEPQCTQGSNFIIVMGDGVGGHYLSGLEPQLAKLGPEWKAKVIAITGSSYGEDAFMATPDVKSNPQKARGILVAGVPVDGDWNIALNWAGANDIPNNPDPTTWDPDAINWLPVDGYLQAADAYNANQCEDRKIIKDGRLTGETKRVCVNAVVTWTPGDVNIAHGRGGLVKVVSSRQYRSQMPAVIVGPMKFAQDHRDEVQGMIAAMLEAGDQIKAYDQALRRAAELSAKVYNDQNAEYWYKYFKGITETDSQGLKVELGGSKVCGLADEKLWFGLGSNDNFRSTYTTFAGIDVQQYPLRFKETPIPPASDIEDKSFVLGAEAVLENGSNTTVAAADVPTYTQSAFASAPKVSSRSYYINFETGKATLTPEGIQTMQQLKDSLALNGLYIKVDGYTDDTGSKAVNDDLSAARAMAVEHWLSSVDPKSFPPARFEAVGHGADNPVASNSTPDGRARNRRVEISLVGS